MTAGAGASMPTSMLVSASYDGKLGRAVLKFYDPEGQRIVEWPDETGHRPYCYSRLAPEELGAVSGRDDVLRVEQETRRDLLADADARVSRIVAADPLAIGGGQADRGIRSSVQAWEADIKYYESYMYDRKLVVGRYYAGEGGRLVQRDMEIGGEVRAALKAMLWDRADGGRMADGGQFREYTEAWADLLNQPIPRIRRAAVDIEVDAEEGRIPDPLAAEGRVTAVGIDGTGGYRRVLVLRRPGAEAGERDLPAGVELTEYPESDERKMILDAFAAMESFPFVLTYNGDQFDMPYLYNRAMRLGIPQAEVPLYMVRDSATLRRGVHLDLYRALSNRAFQTYAFGARYSDYSLNSVAAALLGEEKLDYGVSLGELTLQQTAAYCYNDARLTHGLTTFGGGILMDLLVVVARIARMPVDDVARLGVSQWIRSLMYCEHRARGALIPRRDELEAKTEGVSHDAVIKDKKYRGGLVVDPVAGIHFGVTVMDFASLYPSIIKVRNISYETVRCPHEGCRKNAIPDTAHWACTRNNGMASMLIGSLRDLRVNYYKSLSRDASLTEEQRQQYTVVSQALKVILNASYGVMGADAFPLYFLPAAEATTAVGRHIIAQTIRSCEGMGMEVLYGDTDSLFVKGPTAAQVEEMAKRAMDEHGVELEVDKEYRYVVLSDRKKNYLGVTADGKVDAKGLTGKKSHTPPFIRALFYELLGILAEVEDEEGFEGAKRRAGLRIADCAGRLAAGEIPLEQLSFNVMISKAPSEYTKTVPQHIRAARLLGPGREAKKGDIISYVKTVGRPGVKPVEMARPGDVDTGKYLEFMQSTLEQITSSMGLDFDRVLGRPKQAGLDEFFGYS